MVSGVSLISAATLRTKSDWSSARRGKRTRRALPSLSVTQNGGAAAFDAEAQLAKREAHGRQLLGEDGAAQLGVAELVHDERVQAQQRLAGRRQLVEHGRGRSGLRTTPCSSLYFPSSSSSSSSLLLSISASLSLSSLSSSSSSAWTAAAAESSVTSLVLRLLVVVVDVVRLRLLRVGVGVGGDCTSLSLASSSSGASYRCREGRQQSLDQTRCRHHRRCGRNLRYLRQRR